MKKRYWLAALLGLVLALMTVTGRPAHAAAQRWMCTDGYGCMYNCADPGFDVNAGQNDLQWIQIPTQYRGCASNFSGRNLWTVNYQENVWTCFHARPDSPYKGTTIAAGWMYFNGSGGCGTCPPDLMGQHCPGAQIAHTASKVIYKSAKRYMCPVDTYCQFSGDFYTGQVHEVDGVTVTQNLGHWRQIPAGKRASANDNTAYQINYYSAQTGSVASFHDRFEAGGQYGWWCSGSWSGCNHDLPGVVQRAHLTSAKRDSCPQGPPNWTACFWPNFDFSGTPYQAHPSGGLDQWRTIPSGDRESLSNLTQYTVWVYAVSGSGAGTYGCVDAGDERVDGGIHGRFWMGDFGTCESGFQPLPPS